MKPSLKAVGKVLRILLADDHQVVREGLASILKAKDIKVICEASDAEEASHGATAKLQPFLFGRKNLLSVCGIVFALLARDSLS